MKLIANHNIRLTGILMVTALRFGFTSSDMVAQLQPATWPQITSNLFFSVLTAVILWESNRLLVLYFNKTNPIEKNWKKRIGKETLYALLMNGVVYVLTMAIYFSIDLGGQPPLAFLFFGLFDRFLYGILICAFYEMLFYIDAWRKATQEAEALKKLNVTIQLESLKNQVKPHFLFNSLNTLTGLVEQDSRQAVKFIAELSKVYRYLLQSNEKEVIGLQQELAFTEAYFFLLQTRFGSALSLRVAVPEPVRQQCLIPPLTLQMLVENAVKHNQVSAAKPLQVHIWSEDGQWLLVQNNKQPKRHAAGSNGMGLTNIATKYQLLNQPPMMVQQETQFFTIKVPLIKPATVCTS